MTSDRFDQSARYVAWLDPEGFLAWLFPGFASCLRFVRWLDTRTASGPVTPAQIADTVAEMVAAEHPAPPWLMPIEFQTDPDADMFGRLLGELGTFWCQHRPDDLSGSRYQTAAAVVNLTGTRQSAPASRSYAFPLAAVGLHLHAREVYLAEESAAETLTRIERGEVTSSMLAFIPLMKNADEEGIIARWLDLARKESGARRRDVIGTAAQVLAELKPWSAAWQAALKEWNMRESTLIQSWINLGRDEGLKEGLKEGKLEGKKEGSIEQARRMVVTMLKSRFGTVPPEVQSRIDNTNDVTLLEQAGARIFSASSPEELFPG